MAEMAVQGLLEFWPCKSVNNPNFGLPIGFEPGSVAHYAMVIFENSTLRKSKNFNVPKNFRELFMLCNDSIFTMPLLQYAQKYCTTACI